MLEGEIMALAGGTPEHAPQRSAPLGPPRPAPSPRRRWRAGHPRRTAELHRHDPTRCSRIRPSACDGPCARCRRFRRPSSISSGVPSCLHRHLQSQSARPRCAGTLAPCSPAAQPTGLVLARSKPQVVSPLPWVCSTSALALASAPLTAFACAPSPRERYSVGRRILCRLQKVQKLIWTRPTRDL